MVLDLLSFCEIDGILPDISRKIGNPLEIAAHQQQLERWSDRARVLHHVGQKNAKHRIMQGVHGVIALADFASLRAV